ncbi:16S rRNA (guanine(527)-N(7))-methyltransferase RsmG [Poseidonibacter ostreae]|jgi:16S rRNA (guanine527-N7)-methyltransferase|uniref:Ribosomal RNA small subunit methyltransferase G n=1 Tax=Poseidonibacter ostreae TaxID=2654171 RepID=A0A6L4WSD2_9BACT|nr:16S rRNA (guanine(527)-N(7))-methyltransferase RsmG [Poseidonibacter ostreae]KAB7887129.1 16S rRNA (guanine(527)-N(7))-methyltransferase RsmG [Poseidonibacter ostreae]KAB7888635.1 16S rRNA (guanine(527)-N(7))-methyltransferase RsmG [Poseidonibacter ostreae]KAB7892318.1 16S rRNA (guanine(527)-N(7))-methyltransferase RsmG [Poseidonibacter ostreae]MAC82775.1 16S rRNA (guanine(527)-N(7))-methyltransferase RsmG [Arcobacter sp.]|tara:strand:- start:8268 stop:8855 length:588 start_codon:yes stop_codon:yes gene_type:complete
MNLQELLEENNFEFDKNFYKDCTVFTKLLQQWGKIHNLSGRLTLEDINENILDSIYPLNFIDSYESFADIGTGAGYPGLLLAIARKDMKAYLIEPRVKRVAFLNFVKASLKLDNLTIICDRVEKVNDLKVDLVTSRAVTNTSLLLDITKDIVNENASYLFYKGSMLNEELEAVKVNKNYKIVNRNDRNYLYIKGK